MDTSIEYAAGMEARSLKEAIRKYAAVTPNKVAITLRGHSRTYCELDRASDQVANGLTSIGVGVSDRIGILDKHSASLFEVWIGLSKLSAVIVPINTRLAAPEIECAVSEANLKVLFIGESYVELIGKVRSRLTTVKKIIVLNEGYQVWHQSFATD
jgi:acyl-CoA synthetase (AMP-forming)/AMP-acid ligase II